MIIIKKISILMITVTWLIFARNATIHVDTSTIPKGSGLTVTLTAQGNKIVFPTITTIGGYPIDTPHISKKIEAKYVNGTIQSLREETMQFSFYPEHNVTIPSLAIQIDGQTEHTHATQITVLPTGKSSISNGDYRLQMLTSRKIVYVGEAFGLQVLFFEPRNSNIAQAQYIAPKFDGFFVKSSQKERLENTPEGTAHIFDYILTPQKEGNITISAPQIKLGIQTFSGARDPWGFFNNEIHWRSLQGTPRTITVKPLPLHADLVGKFTIKGSVDATKVKANKPVNFTLTLEGEGNLDDVDEPKIDLPDVTVYSDDAQSSVQIQGDHISSHWEKKYTFIADHNFTIPAITFSAFDPKRRKSTPLSTSPILIHVLGTVAPRNRAQTAATPSTPPATGEIQKPSPDQIQQPPTDPHQSLFEDRPFYDRLAKEKEEKKWPWWSLLISFGSGILFAISILWIRRKLPTREGRTSYRKYSMAEALEILYPHTNNSPEVEKMVRRLYRVQNGEKNIPIDQDELRRLIRKVQKD
jgi:hypothetical protein